MMAETTPAEAPAKAAPPPHAHHDAAAAAPHDDTTLEFKGRIAVTDEDIGGDPYNHTGRFRRAIR